MNVTWKILFQLLLLLSLTQKSHNLKLRISGNIWESLQILEYKDGCKNLAVDNSIVASTVMYDYNQSNKVQSVRFQFENNFSSILYKAKGNNKKGFLQQKDVLIFPVNDSENTIEVESIEIPSDKGIQIEKIEAMKFKQFLQELENKMSPISMGNVNLVNTVDAYEITSLKKAYDINGIMSFFQNDDIVDGSFLNADGGEEGEDTERFKLLELLDKGPQNYADEIVDIMMQHVIQTREKQKYIIDSMRGDEILKNHSNGVLTKLTEIIPTSHIIFPSDDILLTQVVNIAQKILNINAPGNFYEQVGTYVENSPAMWLLTNPLIKFTNTNLKIMSENVSLDNLLDFIMKQILIDGLFNRYMNLLNENYRLFPEPSTKKFQEFVRMYSEENKKSQEPIHQQRVEINCYFIRSVGSIAFPYTESMGKFKETTIYQDFKEKVKNYLTHLKNYALQIGSDLIVQGKNKNEFLFNMEMLRVGSLIFNQEKASFGSKEYKTVDLKMFTLKSERRDLI